ncbi:MAG: DUF1905 domain-containing protein [Frankiales bacterium]|nr:DUF1905 domain-containing protein [Frankiales bacterium]
MHVEFTADVWFWKGPAPWYFVTVPESGAVEIEATAAMVSYGWGMIPVEVRLGDTTWTTSLFPKDGSYVVPIKASVRRAEEIDEGDTVTLRLTIGV